MSFPFNRSNMQLERQRRRSEREYKQNLCPGYPLEAFPGFVFKTVENVHKTVLSPVPVASQSVLGYMSAIAQGEVDVLITPGLKAKPVSLFLLTGAVSGDRKTTTDNLVNAPLHAYDLQQQKEYDEEMVEYKSSMGVWKIKEKVAAKKLKKLLEDGNETTECEAEYKAIKDDEPVQPERRQMIFGDKTFRGMTEVLPEHSASVCLLSSEAGYIIKQLKQSIPQLNDLWDGDDITTNRVSGRRIIRSPRATINWMVQPQYVEDLLLSSKSRARPSGFAARFLFCFPDSLQGYRFKEPGENKKPDLAGLHQLHETGNRLLQKRKAGNNKRTVLTIQNQYHFDQLYNDIEAELRYDGFFREFEDAGSNLLENIARMAALFHVFSGEYEQGSTEISVQHINAACSICTWHMKQFMNLFDKRAPAFQRATKLMSWLEENQHRPRWRTGFSCSLLLQYGPDCVSKRAKLDEAIDIIQEFYRNDFFFVYCPTSGVARFIYTREQHIALNQGPTATNGNGN